MKKGRKSKKYDAKFSKKVGVNFKNKFLAKFFIQLQAFSSFFTFFAPKTLKKHISTMFGVRITKMLVEIYCTLELHSDFILQSRYLLEHLTNPRPQGALVISK